MCPPLVLNLPDQRLDGKELVISQLSEWAMFPYVLSCVISHSVFIHLAGYQYQSQERLHDLIPRPCEVFPTHFWFAMQRPRQSFCSSLHRSLIFHSLDLTDSGSSSRNAGHKSSSALALTGLVSLSRMSHLFLLPYIRQVRQSFSLESLKIYIHCKGRFLDQMRCSLMCFRINDASDWPSAIPRVLTSVFTSTCHDSQSCSFPCYDFVRFFPSLFLTHASPHAPIVILEHKYPTKASQLLQAFPGYLCISLEFLPSSRPVLSSPTVQSDSHIGPPSVLPRASPTCTFRVLYFLLSIIWDGIRHRPLSMHQNISGLSILQPPQSIACPGCSWTTHAPQTLSSDVAGPCKLPIFFFQDLS
jgi:hypothetical protein